MNPEGFNLEALLTAADGFGLTTATPLQRAICRASTGLPLGKLASDPDVIAAFGGAEAIASLPKKPPRLLTLLAGIRSAKSLFSAAKACRASQICDVSGLKSGDFPRISLVSVNRDQAHAVFDHLQGSILASPKLRSLLIGNPTADTLVLRHPTGRPIEVKVVAGSKAGSTLVARWSAGVICDEAPRMQGQADGVVNLDDILRAVRGRMLPGAQIDLIGSPWAPRGTVYDLYTRRFGLPGDDCLIIKAPGAAMNPGKFTPEFLAQLEADDPQTYKTDALAQFADAEDSLLSSVDVQVCTRRGPEFVEYVRGQSYVAAIDPATRGNAWTLVILTSTASEKYQVVYSRQWKGSHSRPLRPVEVLAEVGAVCGRYDVSTVLSDQYSFDALQDLAPAGISLMCSPLTAPLWMTLAERLRALVQRHSIEFPPDPTLRADLLGVTRRLTQRSSSIVLTNTGDGRHGDYVPSLCLCLRYPPDSPSTQVIAPIMDAYERRLIERHQRPADEESANRLLGGGLYG